MDFKVFSLVTIVGSGIWCWILAWLGAKAYRLEPDLLSDPEKMVHLIKTQSFWIVLIVVLFAVLYLGTMRLMRPPKGGQV